MKKVKVAIQQQNIAAGRFSTWLYNTRKNLLSGSEAIVPCGDCTACCTSSFFIHISPNEKQTLSSIPKKLLFAAPGLPKGNVLLGFDENGYCPMFVDNKCSIYDFRPQTCSTFDCRIFAATGLPVEKNKTSIANQARRWKFDFPTILDKKQYVAVHTTAKFIKENSNNFPENFLPTNATQQAILAIKVYEVFLNRITETENTNHTAQTLKIVETIVDAYKKFEAVDKIENYL